MIASGNHLLTQVKDNQPSLRRRLELGAAGRKPSGSAQEPNQRPQSLGNPRIDGVSGQGVVSPYALGNLIKTVLRLGAHGLQAQPRDRALRANERDRLLDILAADQIARELERMDTRALAHRERQPLRARHRLRRGRLPHPQEPRHRRPPALLRLQSDQGARMRQHPKCPLARRSRHQSRPRNASH